MSLEASKTTLGEELKRRRETLGVSLREISDDTRIGVRFLKAIESNQFSILPGGIFNRSFIRAFARHVDMPEEKALHLYTSQIRAAELEEQALSSEPEPAASRAKTFKLSSNSLMLMVGAIGTAVFALVVWASMHYMSRGDAGAAHVGSIPPVIPSRLSPSSSVRSSVFSEARVAASMQPAASGTREKPIRVEIRATQGDCWVSYSLDRQTSTHVLLTPGDHTLLEPKDSLVFTLGNAKAVEVAINGQRAVFDGIVVKNVVVNRDNYQKYLPE